MKRKSYYKAVWLNRIFYLKDFLWSTIGWRLSIPKPHYPQLIPRKPKNQSERDGDMAYWSGYYTWKEMKEKVIPAFEKD